MKNWFLVSMFFLSISIFAQGKITGVVQDENGPLPGANVVIEGTTQGASTSFDGSFALNSTASTGKVVVSYLGYDTAKISFTVNGSVDLGTITLKSEGNVLGEIVVTSSVIDVAKDRKTPVAVSTIKAAEIQERLGSQEFPEVLKSTPSVYTSKSGGGFGDSRITIRGFAQENVAVMINGMPVNDMETGAVFWSNWAGLSDVTSAMQVQRGLGSSKLAISSVGGTINVITKSSTAKQGGVLAATVGNDNYLKTTASYSTGKMENGLSMSFLLGQSMGNGYVDGTMFRAGSYYLGLGYEVNPNHSFELTFTGAPQWHHNRFGRITLDQYLKSGDGVNPNIKYNRDWGYLKGEEFNINRNFYHKPVGSLNYDWKINNNTKLSTVLYGSWGRGGGSGGWGRVNGLAFDNDRLRTSRYGIVDYDKIYAYNSGQTITIPNPTFTGTQNITRTKVGGQFVNTASSSTNTTNGISMISGINSHDWYGGIINLNKKINDFTVDFGVDYRTYTGIHLRYLNNLLGGDVFLDTADKNVAAPGLYTNQTSSATASWNPFYNARKNTPIIRNWDGKVDWIGAFGQAEYSKNNLTAFIQGAISQQGFKRIDRFEYLNTDPLQETGKEKILGGNIKGGLNYNFGEKHNVFINSGYFSKQPFLNAVYPNNRNRLAVNLVNEKIFGLEAGYGFRSKYFNANLNLYRTSWKDRNLRQNDNDVNNPNGFYDFRGVEQVHTGGELDFVSNITDRLKINGMLSIGNWEYKGQVMSARFDALGSEISGGTLTTLYLDGVKVGNTAQTSAAIGATYEVVKNLKLDATYNHIDKLYASINPTDFNKADHRGSLELPSYGLVDAGLSFKINRVKESKDFFSMRLNVNNLLDEIYIAESSTNTHKDATSVLYNDVDVRNQVYFGFGRTWNFTFRYNF